MTNEQIKSLLIEFNNKQYQSVINKSQHLNSLAIHNIRGASFIGLQKFEAAIKEYSSALKFSPRNPDILFNLGNAFLRLKKYSDAINAFESAISERPQFPKALLNLGNAYKQSRQFKNAMSTYERALKFDPSYLAAKLHLIELLKSYDDSGANCDKYSTLNNKIKYEFLPNLSKSDDCELACSINYFLQNINVCDDHLETTLSQIFCRSGTALNCKRHMQLFKTRDVISEFCFNCFKIQIDVSTILDLVRVVGLFYEAQLLDHLPRKAMIEMRPKIKGAYKAQVFCRSITEAQKIKRELDEWLVRLGKNLKSSIKRGCSEYPLKYPEYAKLPHTKRDLMEYPRHWEKIEREFDGINYNDEKTQTLRTLPTYSLSDFLVIQKWVDYAKGIDDPTAEHFSTFDLKYPQVYDIAKSRKLNNLC